MAEREMHKIVIVTRKTRLEELVFQYNTEEQAKFYLEHMGVDFSDYIAEDHQYQKVRKQVREIAEQFARVQEIDRTFVSNMIFGREDIVIALGQDGLVANVMKYLDGQPLLGVNPDTARWDGVLLPFEAGDLPKILPKVINKTFQAQQITMAEAVTKDGQNMLAVNDLFIGCRTHTSARYDIIWNWERESQSSSGIIVSTGLGASGWYRSVMTQINRMTEIFGCGIMIDKPPAWGEQSLMFVVREPFPSRTSQAGIVYGRMKAGEQLRIVSKMPENGVIFSDGMEEDAIPFHAGMEITIQTADRRGALVY